MNDSLNELRSLVETTADSALELESLGGPLLYYGLLLRRVLNSECPAFQDQRDFNDPTQISSGDAITPWRAASCLEDRGRTAAFIRGSIHAVQHALEQSSIRPLHLVEAGCGPLGTLILPLLAHFSSEELVVSLIDLHEESIECTKAMLAHFGFLPRIRQLLHGDATILKIESPVHIILTETMGTALSQEPQVAITRALLRDHANAVLIPQSVRVDFALLDLVAETSRFPVQAGERLILGPVFELSRQTALELVEENGLLPAGAIKIPENVAAELVPCLTTTIQVFENIQAKDYQTQISYPVPVQQPGGLQLSPGDTVRFAYRMSDSPALIWDLPGE